MKGVKLVAMVQITANATITKRVGGMVAKHEVLWCGGG